MATNTPPSHNGINRPTLPNQAQIRHAIYASAIVVSVFQAITRRNCIPRYAKLPITMYYITTHPTCSERKNLVRDTKKMEL
ncbi:hypothetical protein I7I48_08471 [Histoplasma ohiense]|nr:hypothetical protein I7I48_08471 [Histoplasma ohiense (nom. inval.)]